MSHSHCTSGVGVRHFLAPLGVAGLLLAFPLLAFPMLAHAQPGTASRTAAPAPALQGCQQTGTGGGLNTRLPGDVLDHLEGISTSPFVHAFLVHHVAEYGDSTYWLVQCARAFRDADLTDVKGLADKRVEASTLIRELRQANAAWAEEERKRADTKLTLGSLTLELLSDTSTAKVEASAPLIRRAYEAARCSGRGSDFCATLGRVVAQAEAFVALQPQVGLAAEAVEKLDKEVARLVSHQNTVSAELADTGSMAALRMTLGDSLRTLRVAAEFVRDSAAGRRDAIVRESREAAVVLRQRLGALADAFTQQQNRTFSSLAVAAPQDLVRARATPTEVAPAAAAAIPVTLPSASIALALADFVIDRAKQELFLAYLRDVYGQLRSDTLLQVAFGETYALMRSLAPARAGQDLSVVAAGRIPLSVWRATITTDFARLPLRLMQAEPAVVCRGHQPCAERLKRVRPVAIVTGRLVGGDPVLDVLREAPAIALVSWNAPSEELQRMLQGLMVVGGVLDAFAAQGVVPNADPARHPYVLTSRSLGQVPARQQAVFLRLLLARAASVDLAPSRKLDAAPLMESVAMATRAAEQVVAMSQAASGGTANGGAASASALFRHSGAALAVAGDVARRFASAATSQRIDSTVATWKALADVVEPLVAGNYGLAMSRSTMLVQHVAGTAPGRNFLTLVALGAGLAEAQDGGQVRAAFEAAASPAGGWHGKRFREGSRLSLTAFPGAAGGFEWMVGGGEGKSVGVAMPIGLDVQLFSQRTDTTGSPRCVLGFCSVSAFVPLVDLGALLSYRIDSDPDVASEPNTTFQQVFAPGLYASLGFGRSPFALLLGGQFMPSLRKVAAGDPLERSGHAYRLGAGLVVDVTLRSF